MIRLDDICSLQRQDIKHCMHSNGDWALKIGKALAVLCSPNLVIGQRVPPFTKLVTTSGLLIHVLKFKRLVRDTEEGSRLMPNPLCNDLEECKSVCLSRKSDGGQQGPTQHVVNQPYNSRHPDGLLE